MNDAVRAKLQQGRPVDFSPEEAAWLVEAVREAVATTLGVPASEVGDASRLFDALGMDSIDAFDVLDQLAERFEVSVALEELPEAMLRGGEAATFRDFAEGLLGYFREAPAPPRPDA